MPSTLNWQPKSAALRSVLADKQAELDALKQPQALPQAPVWTPPAVQLPPPEANQNQWQPAQPTLTATPGLPSPDNWSYIAPSPPEAPINIPSIQIPKTSTPVPTLPPVAPATTAAAAKPEKDYSKELDPLHPFKIDKDLPLWAKSLQFVGKPFELVQQYLFDPLLAVIQQPFSQKNMTPEELAKAKQEGIASYFPGGVRHQSYEELQYAGKWAVEMLPWLIVPPVGVAGAAGKAGTGVAGALSKLGKAGEFAGRLVEYSPAGITEKLTGKAIGAVTGKVSNQVAEVANQATVDPLVDKMVTTIKQYPNKLRQRNINVKELHAEQLKNMPDVFSGGVEGAKKYMAAARGEAANVPLLAGLTKEEQTQIFDRIGQFKFEGKYPKYQRLRAVSGMRKLIEGTDLPDSSEMAEIQKVFGADFANSLIQEQDRNMINMVSDVLNAPRAALSAVDLSGFGFRQGAVLTFRHPVEAAKTFVPMLKAFLSDKNAKAVNEIIENRPHTQQLKDWNWYRRPLPGEPVKLSAKDEAFASNFVENIPVFGSLIKASNRAYSTVLNDLSSRVGESTLSVWEKVTQATRDKITKLTQTGEWNNLTQKAKDDLIKTANITDVDGKELARFLNASTGRGSLPKALQGASPLFNALLFSPRLFISRLELPTMLLSQSPMVRKEAARTLAQFLGAGTAILGMAKAAGAGVETDPRSADFGKIKLGDTRLDIWTGYTQWARFIAQLTTAQRKTQYGNIADVNRLEVAERFMQSKYSPAAGLLADVLKGESYSGEEVNLDTPNLQRQAWNRLAPLFIQDMIDAVDQEGLYGGVVALPGLFGVGVTTYVSPANKLRNQLAQDKYGKTWDEVGTDPNLGVAAQKDLERSSPQLLALVSQEQADYNKTITGKSDINNIYRNQTTTIENVYKTKIDDAVREYRDTKDGYTFKEKLITAADNRRSQYDVLNKDPQFAKIVARYDELPSASDLKTMSPQDWARKYYYQMLYGPDMYDQYGNYRFDMTDDVRSAFAATFGQNMLDYIETYQGIKEADMPPEYQDFKQAQKILRPYWQVADQVAGMYGKAYAESSRGQALITKLRKQLRASNPTMQKYYQMFYTQA